MPGSMPATSQLEWLSSTTAMIVLFWSRATRDLLRSFGWGIAALHRENAATKLPCLAARPIASIGPRSPVSSVGAARRSCLRGSGSGSTLLLLHFGPLHRAGLRRGLSRLCLAALRGGCRLLAVQLIYTFARHLLNQQFGEGPYQRINAVR